MGIFEELGLRKMINVAGHFTSIGGSVLSQDVIDAMNDAAHHWVEMAELHAKAGKIIADLIGAEAAVVTSGAAAGIVLATAACMAGKDPGKMMQLPHTEHLEKNEVLIQRCHHTPYAYMHKVAGARMQEFGNVELTEPWELETAITHKTAAIAHVVSEVCVHRAELPLDKVIKIAKAYEVPVILDAASALPPFSNLRKWVELGADLVVLSGGKAIEGPNNTGFVYGRKDLIESCVLQNAPNDALGRPFKVSKEQIVGLLVALQNYAKRDHQHDLQVWNDRVQSMLDTFQEIPHVQASREFYEHTGVFVPLVKLVLDEQVIGKTAADIIKTLRQGDPGIATIPFHQQLGIIELDVQFLDDAEERIVVERLKELLRSKR